MCSYKLKVPAHENVASPIYMTLQRILYVIGLFTKDTKKLHNTKKLFTKYMQMINFQVAVDNPCQIILKTDKKQSQQVFMFLRFKVHAYAKLNTHL